MYVPKLKGLRRKPYKGYTPTKWDGKIYNKGKVYTSDKWQDYFASQYEWDGSCPVEYKKYRWELYGKGKP